MTISAVAQDADGDNITYKLYWGTDSNNLTKVDEVTKAQGTTSSFNKTGLSEYTTYYFRVDAFDGKETTTRKCE